jgi:hypothetical protein
VSNTHPQLADIIVNRVIVWTLWACNFILLAAAETRIDLASF